MLQISWEINGDSMLQRAFPLIMSVPGLTGHARPSVALLDIGSVDAVLLVIVVVVNWSLTPIRAGASMTMV